MSYPIGIFKFSSLVYNRDVNTTSWADGYCTRPNNPSPTYMFFFRGKWRTMVYCTIGRTCRKHSKYGDGSYKDEVKTLLVKFSGLEHTREIQIGQAIPFSYTFDLKAISENRWYGQTYGLPLSDGMYVKRDQEIDPNEVMNVNWAEDMKDRDWRTRWGVSYKIRLIQAARNRAWSRKRIS